MPLVAPHIHLNWILEPRRRYFTIFHKSFIFVYTLWLEILLKSPVIAFIIFWFELKQDCLFFVKHYIYTGMHLHMYTALFLLEIFQKTIQQKCLKSLGPVCCCFLTFQKPILITKIDCKAHNLIARDNLSTFSHWQSILMQGSNDCSSGEGLYMFIPIYCAPRKTELLLVCSVTTKGQGGVPISTQGGTSVYFNVFCHDF